VYEEAISHSSWIYHFFIGHPVLDPFLGRTEFYVPEFYV